MDFTPQVETREISDADLDNVSGGLAGGLAGTATHPVDGFDPASGRVVGLIDTAKGATGFDPSDATGMVTGL